VVESEEMKRTRQQLSALGAETRFGEEKSCTTHFATTMSDLQIVSNEFILFFYLQNQRNRIISTHTFDELRSDGDGLTTCHVCILYF
jgi:hypothetical protein